MTTLVPSVEAETPSDILFSMTVNSLSESFRDLHAIKDLPSLGLSESVRDVGAHFFTKSSMPGSGLSPSTIAS